MSDLVAAVLSLLLHHEWLSEVVFLGLVLLGFMHFSAWWFGYFVRWTHQMRLLWRQLRSEPDPNAVHN
jgi:hypothetical protein